MAARRSGSTPSSRDRGRPSYTCGGPSSNLRSNSNVGEEEVGRSTSELTDLQNQLAEIRQAIGARAMEVEKLALSVLQSQNEKTAGKVPLYHGIGDALSFDEWLLGFQEMANGFRWNEEATARQLPLFLVLYVKNDV